MLEGKVAPFEAYRWIERCIPPPPPPPKFSFEASDFSGAFLKGDLFSQNTIPKTCKVLFRNLWKPDIKRGFGIPIYKAHDKETRSLLT